MVCDLQVCRVQVSERNKKNCDYNTCNKTATRAIEDTKSKKTSTYIQHATMRARAASHPHPICPLFIR